MLRIGMSSLIYYNIFRRDFKDNAININADKLKVTQTLNVSRSHFFDEPTYQLFRSAPPPHDFNF